MSAAQSARRTRKKAEDTSAEATDTATDQAEDTAGDAAGGAETLTSELKSAVREAAVEVLKPVARKATLSVAKLAVKQGPSLFKDKIGPAASGLSDKVADAGGAGAFAKGLTSGKGGALSGLTDKIPFVGGGDDDDEEGGKGGRAATGTGRGRRLPVQEWVDVAAPIDVVYDQFTQFEDFPQFMHRVEKIEQRDDTTLMWHENIWGIRRQWEAEITDQEPNRRIAWHSDGVQTTGVVTFHALADNLTRVYMTVDFQPKGFLEKSASGFRLSRRAIKSDLMRFKAYIEMRDDATGEWHGVIEDGEVAESPQEYDERMAEEGDEPEARSDEEYEDEYEDEPVAEEDEADDEYEDEPVAEEDEEYEDEDEADDEETPRRKGRGRFTRASGDEDEEDDEEYEDDEDEPVAEEDEEDEPVAEEDEDDEPVAEDDEEERPRPKRRPRAKAKPKAKAKAKPRARKSKPKAKAS